MHTTLFHLVLLNFNQTQNFECMGLQKSNIITQKLAILILNKKLTKP